MNIQINTAGTTLEQLGKWILHRGRQVSHFWSGSLGK